MSHFAHLRQRITVIQSIRKTTNAMRMIAMSMQGRLKKRDQQLAIYTGLLMGVYHRYYAQRQPVEVSDHGPLPVHDSAPDSAPIVAPLLIIIGSQKALCGSFNEQLWHFIMTQQQLLGSPVITVGAQAAAFARQHTLVSKGDYGEFSTVGIGKIIQGIVEQAMVYPSDTLIVVSNHQRTFFLQEPRMTTIDCSMMKRSSNGIGAGATDLARYLGYLHIQAQITALLQGSLLAEQSARFLAMDTATRNAESLLEVTRLAYNKARQAQVTRELIELTSSYDAV